MFPSEGPPTGVTKGESGDVHLGHVPEARARTRGRPFWPPLSAGAALHARTRAEVVRAARQRVRPYRAPLGPGTFSQANLPASRDGAGNSKIILLAEHYPRRAQGSRRPRPRYLAAPGAIPRCT